MKVQRDGRNVTVEVTADGEGLVSHAGSALLSQVADKSGLTRGLSGGLSSMRERRGAGEPELLEAVRAARAKARRHAWDLGAAPERVTIDVDATLIQSRSEKQGAAGNFKGGFGFHPLLAYFDALFPIERSTRR